MRGFVSRMLGASCIAMLMTVGAANAQAAKKPYEPTVGQQGKDVVWVPTPQALVDRMLDMAKVTPKDILYDLGSGDGRTVITAAKRGLNATGVEFNPDMVALSRRNAQAEGVGDKAKFIQGDIFATDFKHATVVTMFLLSELNLRLRPTLLNMKPGTRVVSNTFDMSDWEPDEQVQANVNCTSYCRAMLWIVPAKVTGNWQLGSDFLSLDQQFQMVMGTYKGAKVSGKLKGDEITFQAGGQTYTGRVNGNRMEGTVGGAKWTAVKK